MKLSKNKKIKYIFSSFLIIQIFYLILSLFIPRLPGYKMFAEIEHIPIQIQNEANQTIEYEMYMPTIYYQFTKTHALNVTRFICQKRYDHVLYLTINQKEKYEFKKPKCEGEKI